MHRWLIVRALAAVLLLGTALLSSSAVHALAWPRWQELVAGSGDLPEAINTITYSEWFDAARADETARRQGSAEVLVCGACDDDSWNVVYRFTLSSRSKLLTQFRTQPAVQTAMVAQWIGGQIRTGEMSPTMSPATVRQDNPQSSAVVEVRGEWVHRPVAPVGVTYRREFLGDLYPTDVTLEVRTGNGLLVTEVTGAKPTAQSAGAVTLDSSGHALERVGVTLAAPDAAQSGAEAASSPSIGEWLNRNVSSLWVGLVALAPLVVVLALLRYARRRYLGHAMRTDPLHAANAAGVVVAAATTVAAVTAWQLSDLLQFAVSRTVPGWDEGPWFHSYGIGYGAALVLAAVGFHLIAAYVERLSAPDWPASIRAARLRTARSAAVAVGVAVLLTLLVFVAFADYPPPELPKPTTVAAMGTLAVLTFCVPVAMAGAAAAALGRAALVPGAAVGAWIGLLAVAMPWTGFAGRPQSVVRYVAVGVLVLVALFAVARLGVVLHSGRRLREHGWGKTGMVALVLLAATPFPAAATAYWSAGVQWDDAWAVPRVIAMVLPLVIALGVLAVARDSLRSTIDSRSGAQVRLLAVAVGALLLFSPTALTAYLPIAYTTALALLWWFTLPVSNASTANLMATLDQTVRPDLTTRLVAAREAERVAARLRRGLDAKVESGDLTWAERQTAVGDVLAAADAAQQGAPTNGLALEIATLGTYPRAPWAWAGRTTVVALVAGLPWIALSVPGLLEFANARGYGPLSTIMAALLTALRWPAIGLLYGLAYPLLRGRTGLTKSLTLFVTIAIPTAVTLLLGPTEPESWRSFLYLASQQLIVCLVLGMATEAELLRLAGRPLSDLTAVHNVRAIVAWVSGLVAALATAATTAVVTGVTALVVGILAPQGVENPNPPTQPSVDSLASTVSSAPAH